jgi:hypothetical protein
MFDAIVIWDLDDDVSGNVAHIAEHDLTKDDVLQALNDPNMRTDVSRTSGNAISFVNTDTHRPRASKSSNAPAALPVLRRRIVTSDCILRDRTASFFARMLDTGGAGSKVKRRLGPLSCKRAFDAGPSFRAIDGQQAFPRARALTASAQRPDSHSIAIDPDGLTMLSDRT